MSAVAASLIAVAGTLLGSFTTYWFQQKAARRSEMAALREHLRQNQLTACSEFAAAISDLRRAVIAVWFRKNRQHRQPADEDVAAEYHGSYAEADRLGAVAETARFRMLLVMDDPELRQVAEAAGAHVGAIMAARDKTQIEKLDMEFDAHMAVFLSAAARLMKSTPGIIV